MLLLILRRLISPRFRDNLKRHPDPGFWKKVGNVANGAVNAVNTVASVASNVADARAAWKGKRDGELGMEDLVARNHSKREPDPGFWKKVGNVANGAVNAVNTAAQVASNVAGTAAQVASNVAGAKAAWKGKRDAEYDMGDLITRESFSAEG
jgi:hypothetical protein